LTHFRIRQITLCIAILAEAIASPAHAQRATAASALNEVITSAISHLNSAPADPKQVQTIFANGMEAISALRKQAQLDKSAPADPAKRPAALRLDLLEAELNHRTGAALPENDKARQNFLLKSAAIYRSVRIAYREIPASAAGYAGESRVLRDMGMVPRADQVLDPVILDLNNAKLKNLSPTLSQLQRLYWFERLQNTRVRDPQSFAELAKQLAASPLMHDASAAEKHQLESLAPTPTPTTASIVDTSRDQVDPIVAIANSIVTADAPGTAAPSIQVVNSGMDDVLRDIRSRGLDVCFVLDATESMGPYIEESKKRFGEIVSIVTKMLGTATPASSAARLAPIRFGLVAFKDYGDDYGIGATKALPLTNDTKKLQAALDEVIAGGGGDIPEPIDRALRVATDNQMGWNRRRHNVIILVTDAPVHATGRDAAYSLATAFAKQAGGEINVIDTGAFAGGKRVRSTVLPDLTRIAENGNGSAFLLGDDQAFWRHLIVSMFGQRYEQDVQAILDQYAQPKK
jgi:Mg-chelatase subunit ChlD